MNLAIQYYHVSIRRWGERREEGGGRIEIGRFYCIH